MQAGNDRLAPASRRFVIHEIARRASPERIYDSWTPHVQKRDTNIPFGTSLPHVRLLVIKENISVTAFFVSWDKAKFTRE